MAYTPNADTQKYLDEYKTPTVQGPLAIRQAVRGFVPVLHKSAQQAGVYSELSQMSETAEADQLMDDLMDEVQRHTAALRRLSGDLILKLREYGEAVQRLQLTNKRIQEQGAVLGYVVPLAVRRTVTKRTAAATKAARAKPGARHSPSAPASRPPVTIGGPPPTF
jgi:hypothetical protein